MSTLTAKGNWNIAKGKIKQTFARFMRDDLQFIEGKVDELIGRIQKRKAESRTRLERAAHGANECGCGHH